MEPGKQSQFHCNLVDDLKSFGWAVDQEGVAISTWNEVTIEIISITLSGFLFAATVCLMHTM